MAKSKKNVNKQTPKARRKAPAKKSRKSDGKNTSARSRESEAETKKSTSKNQEPISKVSRRKKSTGIQRDAEEQFILDELERLFEQDEKEQIKQTRIQKVTTEKSDRTKSKKKTSSGVSKSVKRVKQKLPKLTVTRKRGDNLVKISFDSKSIQNVILAIREYPFNELKPLLYNSKRPFPRVIIIILKIKKPYQKEPFYNSFPVGNETSITSIDVVIDLVTKALADYNNTMSELIEMNYDTHTTVYKIQEIALRFLYP